MRNSQKDPIFIVDDDQGILESFDVMLGDDYHLIMIDNGTEAIERLDDNNPSLLFLDIKIPGRNGLEVLANLREKRNRHPGRGCNSTSPGSISGNC